jgi:hypothetical protein
MMAYNKPTLVVWIYCILDLYEYVSVFCELYWQETDQNESKSMPVS